MERAGLEPATSGLQNVPTVLPSGPCTRRDGISSAKLPCRLHTELPAIAESSFQHISISRFVEAIGPSG